MHSFLSDETQEDSIIPETYVHQTITPYRWEPVYYHVNSRHVTMVKRQAIATKNMFKLWKEPTPDTMNKTFNADFNCTMIPEMLGDREELEKVNRLLIDFMPTYLEIFHYLQASSHHYPLVESTHIMKELFE